jgi:hypothetical protein
VAPTIPIEDIACATAFTEGNPMVVGFLPSCEKTAELQERVGCLPIDPGGDRRIHGLTISTALRAGEVTNGPIDLALDGACRNHWEAQHGLEPLRDFVYTDDQ